MKTLLVFLNSNKAKHLIYKLKRNSFVFIAYFISLLLAIILLFGCSASKIKKSSDSSLYPFSIIKPGEPLAITPFESEDALSNLGGLISDEVTVNLIENVPNIKIIPTSVTRSFLLTSNMTANGIPDFHSIHSLKEGLKCRYLLTGNFYSSIGEIQYTSRYSNRIASGSVTVRLIDCDSATVVWAKHIQDNYQTTSYYTAGSNVKTTYYTDGQLMQELIKRLGENIAEYFYLTK
ncbi:MAG: hypothetical protein A2W11_01305 [Ignavibacteria bacterium RBG_16_35_7]|nr:MAG: hypothetical protein A2W11_01305 [Ignavibacteria bacterium RBG_16_35_7]